MKQIGFVAVLLVCACTVVARHAEAAPSEAEIIAIIDKLVSPNSPPLVGGPDAKYPQGFDRVAQSRVSEAFRKLTQLGLPAFPCLHARLGDERYCFTRDSGPCDNNYSVGHVCGLIIRGHLQPCDYFASYFTSHKLEQPEVFADWWKTHKDKPMRNIQIEVLQWTIAQERQNPEDYSSEELKELNTVLTRLQDSDKPLPPLFPFAK